LASGAFNEGRMEISKQFANIAVYVCPTIKRSLPWMKLAFKRHVGLTTWQALQPAVARIRQIVFSLL
jgi:hypothetical protein